MHWILSYSRRDRKRALSALIEALREKAIQIPSNRVDSKPTIFQDSAIEKGAVWRLELFSELDTCDGGILFLTPDMELKDNADLGVARKEPAIADGEPCFLGRGPRGNGKR